MANPTYTLIGTPQVVGSGGASAITFSSIPATYTDLKVVLSARTSVANTSTTTFLYINGVLTNRSAKFLYGTGSTAGSYSNTAGISGDTNGANSTANTFGNQEIYLPNYASSNPKSYSIDGIVENNTSGTDNTVEFGAGLWNPGIQAGITTIGFAPSAGTFVQYSTFYLYGINNS